MVVHSHASAIQVTGSPYRSDDEADIEIKNKGEADQVTDLASHGG